MARKKKKEKNIIVRILWRIFGAALIVFPLYAFLSCIFCHIGDNSFLSASAAPVKNLLGSGGANTAAFIFNYFGIALFPFLCAIMVWGWQLVRAKELEFPVYRTFSLLFGILGFSMFLSLLPDFTGTFRLGGTVGALFAGHILTIFKKFYVYGYADWIFGTVLLLFTVFFFNFAAGITCRNWLDFGRRLAGWIKTGALWTAAAFRYIFSFAPHRREEKLKETAKEKTPRRKKEKTAKDKEEKKEPGFEKSKPYVPEPAGDDYQYPSLEILSKPKEKSTHNVSQKELDKIALDLENVLQEFGINGKIVKIRPGPVVTLYELEPAPGTKTARVISLADDIARSMSAVSVRIAVVPGSNTIGIEMPNPTREIVYLRELLDCEEFKNAKGALTVTLGKDIGGKNVYADLAKMPHLLVAGTTGSGKSVGVNTMILSLLYKMRPDECKLIMIDPKMLEFSLYNGIPHLLTPVITDPAKAVIGLKWAVKEMEDRYRAMAQLNVRNISGYNQKLRELKASGQKIKRTIQTGFDAETGAPIYEEQDLDLTPLPYIVIIVDEMADLMLVAGKEVEAAIQRLAQMARAAGLHLIMSTQRPSVDVITGTIKANFPTRISFQVTSKIDSRTILGEQGAEQLLGMGDMLYMPAGQRPLRVHAGFVKDSEIESIVEFLKAQRAPEYVEGVTEGQLNEKDSGAVFDKGSFGGGANGGEDDLYAQAVALVKNDKKTSISYVQRRLRIGYNKAATLIERMEEDGIISAPDHAGKREILEG